MNIRYLILLIPIALLIVSCAPQSRYSLYQVPSDKYVPVEEADQKQKYIPPSQRQKTAATPPPTPSYSDELNTAKDADYMTEREQQMIAEINLMRSDPAGYIQYVKEFHKIQMARINDRDKRAEKAATDELIAELKKQKPLSILKPNADLQKAVDKHAAYSKKIRSVDHEGEGGSDAFDRVRAENSAFTSVAENIVGGPYPVREALIILLIDRGVPDRGHRLTLLDDVWQYMACADLGKSIQKMPNSWIQNFAKMNAGVSSEK